MRIAIAEDSLDQARILITLLKKTGYTVDHFVDGLAALEALTTTKYDMLLTDIMMPGMSGFELLSRLKEKGILPPAVVLTSKQREEDIVKALELGAVDFVTKPFSPSVLLAKVKKTIGTPTDPTAT